MSKYCIQCGAKNKEDADKCTACGADITSTNEETNLKENSITYPIILTFISVLLLIGSGILLITSVLGLNKEINVLIIFSPVFISFILYSTGKIISLLQKIEKNTRHKD